MFNTFCLVNYAYWHDNLDSCKCLVLLTLRCLQMYIYFPLFNMVFILFMVFVFIFLPDLVPLF